MAVPGYSDRKGDVQKRLRRVEGQVRGVARMVEDDSYCIEVLTQISAIDKALRAVSLMLLGDHLEHCVSDAISTGSSDAKAKVAEANAAISRLVRS